MHQHILDMTPNNIINMY